MHEQVAQFTCSQYLKPFVETFHNLYNLCLFRVGQGFWVYSISGYLILGIRYFYAKNWQLGITLFLNFMFFQILVFCVNFKLSLGISMFLSGYIGIPLTPGQPHLFSPDDHKAIIHSLFSSKVE